MCQLRKIKRKDLDIEKYSKAINEALNYRIYAEYWYLDILTQEKWECWVYADYQVVMPVPLQNKLGFKFVLQPIYCQQLGVFYKEEIADELFREFEKKLHKYRVRSYCFNEENTERYNPKGEKRVNYILDLNRPYEEIFTNYTKHRRKDIRKSQKLEIQSIQTRNFENFIKLKVSNYPHLLHLIDEKFLIKYLNKIDERGKLICCNILDKNNKLIASQIFIKSGNRNICMGFARDKETENHNSSAFVIDYLIQQFSDKNYFLDFEGSTNSEIAHFMEGFNPTKKYYTLFSNFNFNLRKLKNSLKLTID